MDFNIEARQQHLDNLHQFILSSKEKVQNICDQLGWQVDKVLEDNHLITCSLDMGHKIPQKTVERHVKKCALRKEGYDLNERFLSEPINNPQSSISIDDYKKIEILSEFRKMNDFKSGWNGQDPDPKTSDRLISTYSTHERLALYNHSISSTVGPAKIPEYNVSNLKSDESKPLSYEEQLAQERDSKRRRIKHKAIHTSRKNHTEVLREVIEGQMELYKEWLVDDVKISKREETVGEPKNSIEVKVETESSNVETADSKKSCDKDGEDAYERKIDKYSPEKDSTKFHADNDRDYYCKKSMSYRDNRGERDYYNRKHADDDSDYRKRNRYKDHKSYRERSPYAEQSPYRDRSPYRRYKKHSSRESHRRSRDR